MQRPQIKRILFAADFLAGSRLALDYAVAFAYHFKATIILVHALELSYPARKAEVETRLSSLTRKHAQERLHALANGVRNIGIEVETFLDEAYLPISFRPPSKGTLQICSCLGRTASIAGWHIW
jgi:nucleotide-binding universal stress UspA family protein